MSNLSSFAVVGAGGVGGYFGAKLAQAGKQVHFLLNSDFAHVKQHGLQVTSIHGDFRLNHPNVYATSADMPACDVVLVCLKTTHNHLLSSILPPLLHAHTIVVLIQNGLGMEQDLQHHFPHLRIVGSTAFIGASKPEPGHILHQDNGWLTLGNYSGVDDETLQALATHFAEVGVKARITDLAVARWRKLVWNVAFNGLSVALNTTTDQLVFNPHSRLILLQLMHEVIEASHHLQLSETIPMEFAEQMLVATEQMSAYSPSMRLDYLHGRPLEVEYLYTRPLQEALAAGYEMPTVQMLERQLRFLTK